MKRLCGILLALAGLFLYAPCAAQNTRVRGTVTDAQTGEPIPYAVVLFPGTTTGITTDDEGFYSLESRDTSSYIRAEMVSYEPQIRPVHVGGYNQIDFRLTPSHLEIESVVITPGDNPAHPILEGIIRNKKYNDSKEYDRYICRTYTKMELGLANIREFRSKKLQQNFGFIFEHLDTSSVTGQPYLPVMISETAADYYHSRTPSVAREVIRASQISGIEDNSVLAQFTGHLHADVNLYENFIDLFGVKFASPLSNSGRSFYKYFLVDSTNVEGRKTYKIRFHPKSVATPVLDGEVNIDSASYALRSARVKMAKGVNVNWIRLRLSTSFCASPTATTAGKLRHASSIPPRRTTSSTETTIKTCLSWTMTTTSSAPTTRSNVTKAVHTTISMRCRRSITIPDTATVSDCRPGMSIRSGDFRCCRSITRRMTTT